MSIGLIVFIAVAGTVVFAVLMTVLMLKLKKADKAKLERLTSQAAKRGWRFEERNDEYGGYLAVYSGAPPERARAPKRVESITTGVHRQRPFLSASFVLRQSSNTSNDYSGPTTVEVLGIQLPVECPQLDVDYRSALASRLGAHRHELRFGNEEFDKHYRVVADNEQFARDVLHEGMVGWLASDPRAEGRGFRTRANWLWLRKPSGWSSAVRDFDAIVGGLDFLCDVYERIPGYVWERAAR